MFSLTTGIIKRQLEKAKDNKTKHNKIPMLAKDLDISHEQSKTIVNEKEKYEKMKENIRIITSSGE